MIDIKRFLEFSRENSELQKQGLIMVCDLTNPEVLLEREAFMELTKDMEVETDPPGEIYIEHHVEIEGVQFAYLERIEGKDEDKESI